jgi:cytochrome bd ubiquinol oxidase subunit I
MFSMAMWLILLVAPVQIAIGDAHGLMTREHQPAKIAALEGHRENKPGESVPLILFGWPDMNAETTRYALEMPHIGSLILTHSWNGQIAGLKDFAPGDRPDSTIVFWTFRVMAGLGFLMVLLGLWSAWARWRSELFRPKLLLRFAVLMGPARSDGDSRGMADDGDWTPALGRLRRDADQGCSIEPFGARTFDNADRIHRHVHGRVRDRDQLHAQAGSKRPATLDNHSPEPSGRAARPLSAIPDRFDAAVELSGSKKG